MCVSGSSVVYDGSAGGGGVACWPDLVRDWGLFTQNVDGSLFVDVAANFDYDINVSEDSVFPLNWDAIDIACPSVPVIEVGADYVRSIVQLDEKPGVVSSVIRVLLDADIAWDFDSLTGLDVDWSQISEFVTRNGNVVLNHFEEVCVRKQRHEVFQVRLHVRKISLQSCYFSLEGVNSTSNGRNIGLKGLGPIFSICGSVFHACKSSILFRLLALQITDVWFDIGDGWSIGTLRTLKARDGGLSVGESSLHIRDSVTIVSDFLTLRANSRLRLTGSDRWWKESIALL